jgi:hypothetical protein
VAAAGDDAGEPRARVLVADPGTEGEGAPEEEDAEAATPPADGRRHALPVLVDRVDDVVDRFGAEPHRLAVRDAGRGPEADGVVAEAPGGRHRRDEIGLAAQAEVELEGADRQRNAGEVHEREPAAPRLRGPGERPEEDGSEESDPAPGYDHVLEEQEQVRDRDARDRQEPSRTRHPPSRSPPEHG